MKKLYTICLLTLSALVSAYAGGLASVKAPPYGYFNGFYIGANGGVANGLFQNKHTYFEDTFQGGGFPGVFAGDADIDRQKLTKTGGVVAGFGWAFKQFYLGLQFEGNFGDINVIYTFDQTPQANNPGFFRFFTTTTAQLSHAYGGTVRLGFLASPSVLLFAEAGGMRSTVQFISFTESNVHLATFPTPFTLTNTKKTKVSGLRFGVGFEKMFSQHISFILSYLWTRYKAIENFVRRDFPVPPQTFMSDNTKITVWTNRLLLGLNFHFRQFLGNGHFASWAKTSDTFNGFFASLAGGIQQAIFHQHIKSSINALNIFGHENNLSEDVTETEGVGSAFVGYGHLFGEFGFLGAEIGGSFGEINEESIHFTSNANGTIVNFLIKMKLGGSYAYLFKPGIFLGPHTLFYGLVGQAFTKLSVNSSLTDTSANLPSSTLLDSGSKRVSGLRLGLGLEQEIWCHLHLFLRYMYTNYNMKLNRAAQGIAVVPGSNTAVSLTAISTNTKTNDLELGLIFYFG